MLLNSGIYQKHILDMDGVILWTTELLSLSTDSIIGKEIGEILYPGDAVPARWALFQAATGKNYQWYKFALNDEVYLALVEFLPKHHLFSIHEARMTGSNNNKRFKNFLIAASGCYPQFIDKKTTYMIQ